MMYGLQIVVASMTKSAVPVPYPAQVNLLNDITSVTVNNLLRTSMDKELAGINQGSGN